MFKCWMRTLSMAHLTSLLLRISQTSMIGLNGIWLSVRRSTSHYTRQEHHRFPDRRNLFNGGRQCRHLQNERLKITINSPLCLTFLLCSHRTEAVMGQLAVDTSLTLLILTTPLEHLRAPTVRRGDMTLRQGQIFQMPLLFRLRCPLVRQAHQYRHQKSPRLHSHHLLSTTTRNPHRLLHLSHSALMYLASLPFKHQVTPNPQLPRSNHNRPLPHSVRQRLLHPLPRFLSSRFMPLLQ